MAFGLLYIRFRANLCLQLSTGMVQGGAIILVRLKINAGGKNGGHMYSLFHILMIKTNHDQLENFKRIEKSSVNPIAAVDLKYMKKNYNKIHKQKKN